MWQKQFKIEFFFLAAKQRERERVAQHLGVGHAVRDDAEQPQTEDERHREQPDEDDVLSGRAVSDPESPCHRRVGAAPAAGPLRQERRELGRDRVKRRRSAGAHDGPAHKGRPNQREQRETQGRSDGRLVRLGANRLL